MTSFVVSASERVQNFDNPTWRLWFACWCGLHRYSVSNLVCFVFQWKVKLLMLVVLFINVAVGCQFWKRCWKVLIVEGAGWNKMALGINTSLKIEFWRLFAVIYNYQTLNLVYVFNNYNCCFRVNRKMDGTMDHRLLMLQDMRSQNYDSIRFASYRTASKLRFVQKKAHCTLCTVGFYDLFIVCFCSKQCWYLERDRNIPWKWAEHVGCQCWGECIAFGNTDIITLSQS